MAILHTCVSLIRHWRQEVICTECGTHVRTRTHRHPHPYQCGELPFWQVIFFLFFFVLFFCLTESCLFVVYSFHSPQVLLEFCGFMQLSAVSFFSEFSRVLWSTVFQLGIL